MSVASLGEYRLAAIAQLQRRLGRRFCLYAGVTAYDPSIRVLTSVEVDLVELRNVYVKGDLLFQNIPWRRYLSSQSLLLDLNPRVPHIWILLVVRRILGKRTVLWGHAWPRGGRRQRSERIRRCMRALSSAVVTYTNTQADELKRAQPALTVVAAPNALYSRTEMVFDRSTERRRILFVGRLVEEKKPELLLQAFELAAEAIPDALLTFVGEGPLAAKLKTSVLKSSYRNRIELLGHIGDLELLRRLYGESVVSVSPGYVGLSATQSFGFGVPMLISQDEPHSPEIEAADVSRNAQMFRTDDRAALSSSLIGFWANRLLWSSRGPEIAEKCAATYSVERMVDGLVAALTGELQ
jgi:glycosyltransferase involved in cell wall biosynthesis